MPLAARYTDTIQHTPMFAAMLAGAGVGAGVGIAIIFFASNPVGWVAGIAVVAGTIVTGAEVGEIFASHSDAEECGTICLGALSVRINGKFAARYMDDTVYCQGNFILAHEVNKIARGSESVYIKRKNAARIGEPTECGATIRTGSEDVIIGGESFGTLEIDAEVPDWFKHALGGLGIVSIAAGIPALLKLGFKKAFMLAGGGLAGGVVVGAGGSYVGGALFGEGSLGQELMAYGGAMAGGALGALGAGRLASRSRANQRKECCEPVDTGSGSVVESIVDLELPGLIPCTWTRNYNSSQRYEKAALGRGGWTHSFDQWVIQWPGQTVLRDEEGRDVYFQVLKPGQNSFHRSDRLSLTALDGGRFEVFCLQTRLTRSFAPLEEGGVAVLQAIRDAHGNEIVLNYSQGQLCRIIDTAGRNILVISDHERRVLRVQVEVEGAVEQWFDYSYTERGELSSATDSLGNMERYAYDIEFRLVRKTLKNSINFYYEYDERTGWCCRTWGDGGLHSGRIRVDGEKRITYLEENEEPRLYHWNDDGLVTREELPDGTLIGTWEYDSDSYLLAEANGAGETTRHEYDARGNRVRTTDPAGNVTEYSYADDLPTRRIGSDQLETRYWHGSKGELLQVAHPSGAYYRLEYDERGRLTSVNDGEHVIRRFGYDERHDCVLEVDARGASTQYAYDALGRATTRRDALGRMTQAEYDPLGRALSITAPDGTVTRREYDAYGNVTQEVDPLGGVTEMQYAGTGKLAKMVRPDGTIWHLRYDGVERLREIFNPHSELYAFDYDQAGRVITERTFDGRTLKYAYSDAGRVSSIVEPDGATRELQYDRLGAVTNDKTADGTITFERDKLGRLSRATLQERSGKVVTSFLRDELGLVIEERQNERAVHYRYDRFGRRTERVLSDGSTTRYGYDPDHALRLLEHNGKRFVLERDIVGREVSRHSGPEGFQIRNAYDSMDRLTERFVASAGRHSVSSKRAWKYDELGRVIEIEDDRWGLTAYRYDSIGQLLQAKRRSYCEVFHYDATGSLRKIFEGLKGPRRGKAWDTAPGNLLKLSDRAEYEYDARGRRIKKTSLVDGEGTYAGEVTTYRWDDRDRLREVVKASGERVLFTYDAFGRRVRKEVHAASSNGDGRVVEFVWDGDELGGDFDSTHGARVFVHEPGTFVPALQAEQGEVFAVVNDHLGMPKELIDAEGKVAWSAAHSAWGRVIEAYGDEETRRERKVESPFRLLGQYADDETGLCYTRFRYFDAETGRWCSPDPLGIVGGLNLMSMDPSLVDPMGLAPPTPFGFIDANQFNAFARIIDRHMSGLVHHYEAIVQGSAASGRSFHTGRPFGPHSDIDLALVSRELFDAAEAAGADIRGQMRTAPNVLPDLLDPMRAELSQLLGGREVNVMVYGSGREAAARGPNIKVPKPCPT